VPLLMGSHGLRCVVQGVRLNNRRVSSAGPFLSNSILRSKTFLHLHKRVSRDFLPHQIPIFDYCKNTTHPILYVEMRLGKTYVTIRWVQWLYQEKYRRPLRVLVLAPVTVLTTWENELRQEREQFLSEYGLHRTHRALDALLVHENEIDKTLWFLTNYEVLNTTAALEALPWDVVIADESTQIRKIEARRTKIAIRGFRQARHRAELSGLPNPEGEEDFVTQMLFADGHFMGYKDVYAWRARNTNMVPYLGRVVKRDVRSRIKEYVHNRAYILSRKQAGVGSRKVYEVRTIPIPLSLKKAYQQAKKQFRLELENKEFETKWQVALETWLARLAGGFDPDGNLVSDHKIKEITSLLDGELKCEQIVISFRFDAEIQEVYKALTAKKIEAVILNGETKMERRASIVKGFNRGEWQVALLQAKLARYSLDFSGSDTLIHYSRWWDNEINAQIEDRIISPTKDTPVLILDLESMGTSDSKIIPGVKSKRFNSNLMLRMFREEWLK
jgi:SNF2 family DNA or RNA helicase